MEENNQPTCIMLARKPHGIVTKMISRWQEYGVIDQQTGARLTSSIGVSPFDWKRTARPLCLCYRDLLSGDRVGGGSGR